MKMNANVVIPERVKSNKKPTQAVGIRLVSEERSVKRGLFESEKREKERVKEEEMERQEQERLLREEEEVRKIRAACNFKATPIKKYKLSLGSVPQKKLTVP